MGVSDDAAGHAVPVGSRNLIGEARDVKVIFHIDGHGVCKRRLRHAVF
jgi:hypothetical protein